MTVRKRLKNKTNERSRIQSVKCFRRSRSTQAHTTYTQARTRLHFPFPIPKVNKLLNKV